MKEVDNKVLLTWCNGECDVLMGYVGFSFDVAVAPFEHTHTTHCCDKKFQS